MGSECKGQQAGSEQLTKDKLMVKVDAGVKIQPSVNKFGQGNSKNKTNPISVQNVKSAFYQNVQDTRQNNIKLTNTEGRGRTEIHKESEEIKQVDRKTGNQLKKKKTKKIENRKNRNLKVELQLAKYHIKTENKLNNMFNVEQKQDRDRFIFTL